MTGKEFSGMTIGEYLNYKLGIYIPKNQESRARNCLDSLIRSAKKRIILVTGNFDRTFYDGDIGEYFLKNILNGMDLNILLKEKVPDNYDNSVKTFINHNYPFFNAVFHGGIPGYNYECLVNNFHVYFSRIRSDSHFCVADNDVFFETNHNPGETRAIHVKYDSEIFAKGYTDTFKRIKNSKMVYSVNLDDLISAYKNQLLQFERKIA